MFKRNNRYVTRGVNEEVDIRLQLIMWSMIDNLKDKGNVEVDYLQVFKLRKEGASIVIEHSQEEPEYKEVYSLANKWNQRGLIVELNNKKKINLKKLQEELNYIQFNLINNYNKVVELCDGTGYDNETLMYIDLDVGKYVIKLIPVRDTYSYIYTYFKEIS